MQMLKMQVVTEEDYYDTLGYPIAVQKIIYWQMEYSIAIQKFLYLYFVPFSDPVFGPVHNSYDISKVL